MAKQVAKTSVLDSHCETREHTEFRNVHNSRGEVVSTIACPTTRIVTVKTCQDDCRCKHCGHEWSKVYTQEL